MRSLQIHSIDVKCDPTIFNSDLLLFTETQLKSTDLDSEIKAIRSHFELYSRVRGVGGVGGHFFEKCKELLRKNVFSPPTLSH